MIGQSVINVTSGGRGRLSTFTAGAFLLFLLAVLGPFVGRIPMPALVAVMIMVSIGTFSWNSIPNLRRHPWPSSVVMLTTVVVVVATHDLSMGVLAGVLLSGIFFAGKVQRMFAVERTVSPDGAPATYRVSGQIFFASVERFVRAFQVEESAPTVLIDMTARAFLGHLGSRCARQDRRAAAARGPHGRNGGLQPGKRGHRRQVRAARQDGFRNRRRAALKKVRAEADQLLPVGC